MQTLLKAGLSESAYKEIAGMQVDAGARLADALINGNMAENIARTNDAIGSVAAVGAVTGQMAAQQYAGIGLTMAAALVQTLLDSLGEKGKGRKALVDLMDNLTATMNRTVTVSIVTTYSTSGPAGVAAEALAAGASAADAAAAAGAAAIGANFGFTPTPSVPAADAGNFFGGIRTFAAGGSVMAGRPILVGEKGPELFVPGSNGSIVPNGGGSLVGGNNYQITVQAGVGDPRAIGQQIVEYVKKFEQANGPVFQAA
jgi:hypothetical protein